MRTRIVLCAILCCVTSCSRNEGARNQPSATQKSAASPEYSVDLTNKIGKMPKELCDLLDSVYFKGKNLPIPVSHDMSIERGGYDLNIKFAPFSWNGLEVIGVYQDGQSGTDYVETGVILKSNKSETLRAIRENVGLKNMKWTIPVGMYDGGELAIIENDGLMKGVKVNGTGSIGLCAFSGGD